MKKKLIVLAALAGATALVAVGVLPAEAVNGVRGYVNGV